MGEFEGTGSKVNHYVVIFKERGNLKLVWFMDRKIRKVSVNVSLAILKEALKEPQVAIDVPFATLTIVLLGL